MATSPQALMDEAECFNCYASNYTTLLLMKLALLRQWALLVDPSADVSPETLLAEAKCYLCFTASPYMLDLIELALLAQLASGEP